MRYESKIQEAIIEYSTDSHIESIGKDADKEIHDLKELITQYEQNLGALSLCFHQNKPEKAEKELTRFISELDERDK